MQELLRAAKELAASVGQRASPRAAASPTAEERARAKEHAHASDDEAARQLNFAQLEHTQAAATVEPTVGRRRATPSDWHARLKLPQASGSTLVRGFYTHATVYVLVGIALLAINLITNPDSLWFYWPLLAWGIGLAVHAFTVFGPSRIMGQDWEDRTIRELMERDRRG